MFPRRYFSRMCAWSLVVLVPVLANAGSRTGNVIYSVPEGWSEKQDQGRILLSPPGLASGEACTLAVYPGKKLSRGFRESFEHVWAGVTSGGRIVEGGQIQSSQDRRGFEKLQVAAVVEGRDGDQAYVLLYAANPADEADLITVIASSREVYKRYQKDVAEFINTLHYANVEPNYVPPEGGPSTPPSPASREVAPRAIRPLPHTTLAPGRLDGVYVAMVFGSVYHRLIRRYMVFYPDGRVMQNLPKGGLSGFDFDAHARDPDNRVGRYRVDGNVINIIWGDDPNSRDAVGLNEHAEDVGELNTYVPTCRCDGVRFSGTYDVSFLRAGSYDEIHDPLQFFPDGTFVDPYGGLDLTLNEHMENPVRGRGTYAVQDHTLFLKFDNGYSIRASFAAPPVQQKGQSFNWIDVEYNTLYEKNYHPAP